MPGLIMCHMLLMQCTTLQLRHLTVSVGGIYKFVSATDVLPWEAFQHACGALDSLRSVVFEQDAGQPSITTILDENEAVIRERLPDLQQKGLLTFRRTS